ncbi:MAG: hypothetical protein LBV74_00775, partial [Tannerella sp.]|nr:hypothetical protein [Tannerella sp.]
MKTGIHICELDYDPRTGRFINEDPAFDGDNWYTYCGSNPINSFDPSGLVSIRNTYLSDKYPNFPNGTGGTNALRITIKRNTVKILWNCYFTGDNVDKKVMKSTYREIITSAIEKKWSGTFKVKGIKNVKVKTKVWDKSNGKDHIYETGQKWSKITFHREVGVSNVSGTGKFLWWGGWKRNKLGNMNLYIGDKRDGSDHRYSKNQLQI